MMLKYIMLLNGDIAEFVANWDVLCGTYHQ